MNSPNDLVAAALVAAQGELQAASFDSTNPFLKNRYASLGAIIEESRPVLAKHGLAVLQTPTTDQNNVIVSTVILHKSGQWLDCGSLHLPIGDEKGKSLAQVTGSLITYMRRYSWATVLGMYADEDTDGNEPVKGSAPRRSVPVPTTTITPPPAPQNASQPHSNATVASPKFRLAALNRLEAAPGQPHRNLVGDYLRSKHWITGEQECEAWPLEHVPCSPSQMDALTADIRKFETEMRGEVVP